MFREMFYLLSRSVENWDDDVGNSNCKPIAVSYTHLTLPTICSV